MAEVELNVVCKHCGAEVSPFITECPYCGKRLRKRAPKLETRGSELAPKERKGFFAKRKRRQRPEQAERSLGWLAADRPYGTIALVLAGGAVYIVDRASGLGYFDLGAIVGPIDSEWWRLVTAQFVYLNIGYLLAVGVAVAIFGSSLERRYGPLATVALFLGAGAAGIYLGTVVESFPIALGGNGGSLGLLSAWLVLDLRSRRSGQDNESDLLGTATIAAVLLAMPLLDETANWWAGFGGAAVGALIGSILPQRR